MSMVNVEKAVQRHLKALSPDLPTAYEAVSFDPPNSIYQMLSFRPLQPVDINLTADYYREKLIANIYVVGLKNKGKGEVLTRAELIRTHFKKGTTLLEGTLPNQDIVRVIRTPQISGATMSQDRIVVPIFIEIETDVFC